VDDIRKAVRACSVVVVHIGDGWETALRKRADTDDGLRDELEAALEEERIRIVPVLTSDKDNFGMYQRMAKIESELQALREKAPNLCKKFTARLQVQRLREDPDFSQDLERLMRAVWVEFRSSPRQGIENAREHSVR
jgi:hypothetical protein